MVFKPKKSRLANNDAANKLRTYLADSMSAGVEAGNFPFFLGQVMNSNDPQNANRLQIRIPLIDDVFYLNEEGIKIDDSSLDSELPWCMPSNNHFINTPENNSIVLVALFNKKTPYNGRVWFTAFEELSNKSIFDVIKLAKESFDWDNAESVIETAYDSSPGLRNREVWKNRNFSINYPVGIKGKDKNKLLLDKGKTTLIQNEGTNQESKLELTENVNIKGKNINLLSTQSNESFSPVFAEPLYEHLENLENLIEQIIKALVISPGNANGTPVIANPSFSINLTRLQQLKVKLQQLKSPGQGKSGFMKIN